jgi:hypothetical protein
MSNGKNGKKKGDFSVLSGLFRIMQSIDSFIPIFWSKNPEFPHFLCCTT